MSRTNGFSVPKSRLGRIVVVGASLAGLRAAETLRTEGFAGELVMVGDEPDAPYDRPPLSKQFLAGRVPVAHTGLAQLVEIDADWRLGVPATQLHVRDQELQLADGQRLEFDRLLIATGTRARPWPNPAEARLDGVFTLRTSDDSRQLRARLESQPRRVLIVGSGFIGSEVASVCCELGLPVTVVERGTAAVSAALGQTVGQLIANMHVKSGVDLRLGTTVTMLDGDAAGRVRRAHLSDGSMLDVGVVMIALGAMRNTEWLADSGLAADGRGVVCDAACRVFDEDGMVLDNVFVAGDVARWPHRLYENQLLAVEHWNNAVEQARTAAHNMVCEPRDRRAHTVLPTFWSHQFGVNIKTVGVPSFGEEVLLTQGSVRQRRFVAAYGHQGRLVAAVSFNLALRLPTYAALIEASAPFPPNLHAPDEPSDIVTLPSMFPEPSETRYTGLARATGYRLPNARASLNTIKSAGSIATVTSPTIGRARV
jgi:NADPH-dependent 2,4-dienoyl-CoA reductase/sulfur reductase-like enzyme